MLKSFLSRQLSLVGALSLACSPAGEGSKSSGVIGSETTENAVGGSGSVIDTATGGTALVVVGDASTSSGGTGSSDCGHKQFPLAQRPADVLLVLDRSASMEEDMSPTKWSMVVPALEQVITVTDASVAWGLKVFPEGTAGQCTQATYPTNIAVPIAPSNRDAVITGIRSTIPDGNGTPTGDAVAEAVNYLRTVQDSNPKYILVATDGEPSCNAMNGDTDSAGARTKAIAAVTSAATAGFHTFVVGIATTKESATKSLNGMAVAGLEPRSDPNPLALKYYLASTQGELVSALSSITSVVATCAFDLDAAPPDPDLVNVYIGTEPVARDRESANGWNYTTPDYLAFQLFGSACDKVKSLGAQTVDVVYVCPGETVY